MLPHRSILSNCRGAFELLRPLRLKDEVYLSYLPTSHSYEHTVGRVSAAQPRHGDRLCARRRAPGGRYADGAADHPDRGAARAGGDPHARADPGGAAAEMAAGAVPPRAGYRLEARRRTASWSPGTRAGSAARSAGAGQGAGPVRRTAESGDVGWRSAGTGGGALLPGARADDHAGLWPDRGRSGDQRQSARRHPHRHGRARAGGR